MVLPLAAVGGLGELASPPHASAVSSTPGDVVATFSPTPRAQFVRARELRFAGIKAFEVVLGPADFEDELPLVVMIHGRGDRARIPDGDHHDTAPVRLLYPQAPTPYGSGFSWFPVSVTDPVDEKVLGEAIRDRADQLAALIEHVASTRPTEGRPIVSGFSQGGMLSYGLALRHPELIEFAVPMAAWLPRYLVDESLRDEPEATQFPEIYVLHGDHDPVVPFGADRALSEDLAAAGLPVHFEAFPAHRHTITAAMAARQRALLTQAIHAHRARSRTLG